MSRVKLRGARLRTKLVRPAPSRACVARQCVVNHPSDNSPVRKPPLASPEEAKAPVVEPQPPDAPAGDSGAQALQQRVRQQEILAELGVLALKGTPFPELLDHTAQVTAEGLRADFSKVLEYLPAEGCLVVRAGVGWPQGVVGVATVGADLASPAGFASPRTPPSPP